MPRAEMLDHRHLVPAVRFAVDAYITFARTKPWTIAVASSLTELFAPDLMATRLAAFEKYYTWIDPEGLTYFRNRLHQAPRDSEHALEVVARALPDPGDRAAGLRRARVQERHAVGRHGRHRPRLSRMTTTVPTTGRPRARARREDAVRPHPRPARAAAARDRRRPERHRHRDPRALRRDADGGRDRRRPARGLRRGARGAGPRVSSASSSSGGTWRYESDRQPSRGPRWGSSPS